MVDGVQAHITVARDVGVKDLSDESDFGWPHGVAAMKVSQSAVSSEWNISDQVVIMKR